MKWITHQTGALVACLALNLSVPAMATAWLGSVFPDVLDMARARNTGKKRQKTFNRIHRGASHWLGWWLGLLAPALALPPLPLDLAAGFVFGGLSHICLDMLTPRGVPILPFTRKGSISLAMCSTGKAGEYVFLAFIACLGAWLIAQKTGYF